MTDYAKDGTAEVPSGDWSIDATKPTRKGVWQAYHCRIILSARVTAVGTSRQKRPREQLDKGLQDDSVKRPNIFAILQEDDEEMDREIAAAEERMKAQHNEQLNAMSHLSGQISELNNTMQNGFAGLTSLMERFLSGMYRNENTFISPPGIPPSGNRGSNTALGLFRNNNSI